MGVSNVWKFVENEEKPAQIIISMVGSKPRECGDALDVERGNCFQDKGVKMCVKYCR